jgi:four helix bundle protein
MKTKATDWMREVEEGSLPYQKKKVRSFKDLVVWEKSYALTLELYHATKEFPASEKFHLTNQIRRAASSIPINIAEGMGRKTRKEFIRYLIVARGSCEEVSCILMLSRDLGYLDATAFEKNNQSIQEIGKMLNGLIRAIRG